MYDIFHITLRFSIRSRNQDGVIESNKILGEENIQISIN